MNKFSAYLVDLIETKNLKALEALMVHVMPHLGEEDKKSAISHMRYSLKDKHTQEAAFLMMGTLGADPDTSAQYMIARIKYRDLDREQLHHHAANLGDTYGHVLTYAIFRGDYDVVRIVHDLYRNYYPVKICYKDGDLEADGIRIDDKTVTMEVQNSQETQFIFDVIHESGMTPLLGRDNDGSGWILRKGLEHAAILSRKGEVPTLPQLVKGTLHNPELVLALHEKRSRSNYPELYEKVFIWVDKQDVDIVPGIAVEPRQSFTMGHEGKGKAHADRHVFPKTFRLEEFDTVIDKGELYSPDEPWKNPLRGMNALTDLFVGLNPITDDVKSQLTFYQLAQHFLTERQRLGLDMVEGKVLMLVSVEDALCLQFEAPDVVSIDRAEFFTKDFFPLGLLVDLHKSRYVFERDKIVLDTGINLKASDYHDSLIKRLANVSDRLDVRSLLPASYIKSFLNQKGLMCSGDDLRQIMLKTGFDFDRKKFDLSGVKLLEYENAGVRLGSYNPEIGFSKKADLEQPLQKDGAYLLSAMKIGLWPGPESDMNISIKDAITNALRLKDDTLYKSYLMFRGAEDVAPLIKTESHFNLFSEIFGEDQVRAQLSSLPKKFRDGVLASDLGI